MDAPSLAGPSQKAFAKSASLQAWAIVLGLVLIYILAILDRNILNMLVAPIEQDVHLSDFQISLLMGPAFGVFYVLFGLAIGSLLDRYPRGAVLGASMLLWGAATCSCAIAGTFSQLAIGRLGVGIGESALTPSAHAIMAERFPRHRLGSALAVFSTGAVIGIGLASMIGGAIIHFTEHSGTTAGAETWRSAFLIVGIATILISPLAMILSRNRKLPSREATAGTVERASWRGLFRVVMRRPRLFVCAPLGAGAVGMLNASFNAWLPTYLVRRFGWNMGAIGSVLGIQHIVVGLAGLIGGGMIIDMLYRRGVSDAHVRYTSFAIMISAPLVVLAFAMNNAFAFLLLISIFYLATIGSMSFTAAAMQLYCPDEFRARMAAMLLAIVVTTSTLLGPTSISWLTDFVFRDQAMLGTSLAIVTVAGAVIAVVMLRLAGIELRLLHSEATAGEAALN